MFHKVTDWIREHKYCYALLYMIFYLVMFFTLEQVMTPRYIIHCGLDEVIPFCEYMIIPYLSWLVIFPGSLFFFLFWDREDFLNLCMIMFSGSTICFLAYMIWPSGLNLRIEITSDTVLAKFIQALWSFDTPTNVCPSLHVSTSTAIIAVLMRSKRMKKYPVRKYLAVFWLALICVSTVFVKQHSVIDVLWGCVVSLVFYIVAYYTDWQKLFKKTFLKVIFD